METGVKRAEWGIVISIVISLATAIFTVGYIYGQVQENTRRLLIVETDTRVMQTTLVRVDANVTFLTTRAIEDRADRLERQMR
jgi:MFS superfamily sulfate permease-like transporter